MDTTPKVTERINDDGAVEVNVKTVDYRLPAGRDENPDKEKVEITHLTEEEQRETGNVVAKAAAEVGKKLQEAKEAIFPPAGDKGDTYTK